MDFQTISGLVFLYAVISSVCSGINEWLNATLKTRPTGLLRGLTAMLPDEYGRRLIGQVLDSHIIQGVSAPGRGGKMQLPSYLQSNTVVDALFESLVPARADGTFRTIDNINDAIQQMPAGATRTIFANFLDQSGGDVKVFRKKLEDFYDEAMARLSGSFKRNSQVRIAMIAAVVCTAFNIDANDVVRNLSFSKQLQASDVLNNKRFLDMASKRASVELIQDSLKKAQDDLKSLKSRRDATVAKSTGDTEAAKARAKQDLEDAQKRVTDAEAELAKTNVNAKPLADIVAKTADATAKKSAQDSLDTFLKPAQDASKNAKDALKQLEADQAKAAATGTVASTEQASLSEEIKTAETRVKGLEKALVEAQERRKTLVAGPAPAAAPGGAGATTAPAGGVVPKPETKADTKAETKAETKSSVTDRITSALSSLTSQPDQQTVAEDELVRREVADLNTILEPLHALPVGYDLNGFFGVRKVMGILLSTVIVTMMAPFSFDLINSLVNVRAAGKKPSAGE